MEYSSSELRHPRSCSEPAQLAGCRHLWIVVRDSYFKITDELADVEAVRLSVIYSAPAVRINSRTLYRLENGGEILVSAKKRHGHVEIAVWSQIIDALVARGVIFLTPDTHRGAGVARKKS